MQTKYDKPVVRIIMLDNDCIRTSGLQNGGDYDLDNPTGSSNWENLFEKK